MFSFFGGVPEVYAEKGGRAGFMLEGRPGTWKPAGAGDEQKVAKAKNRQEGQTKALTRSQMPYPLEEFDLTRVPGRYTQPGGGGFAPSFNPAGGEDAQNLRSEPGPFNPGVTPTMPAPRNPPRNPPRNEPRNGGGMSTGGGDVRSTNGIEQKGTNMSSSPVNIPGFQRDPFASLNLPGTSNRQDAGMAMIGGKSYPVSEEAMADRVNDDPNFQVNPEFGGNTGKKGDEPNIEDDLDYQLAISDNDVARRAAVLGSVGTGPMGMRRARGQAMGMYDEIDENGMMTGNSVLNTGKNDGKGTVITGDQTNDYINRGNKFLDDVLSGKITLGQQGNEPATADNGFMVPDSFQRMSNTSMLMDTDPSDANSIFQYDDGGSNQVQFGQQPQVDGLSEYVDPEDVDYFSRRNF